MATFLWTKPKMIEDEFDLANIGSVNFAVALRSNGNRYFVPTDGAIKEALKEVLRATVASFASIGGDWEAHDVSEDYGELRRTYAPRDTDYLADLSAIFDAGDLDDLANAHEHVQDIDFYFGVFHDETGQKAVGIKKGTQLKGTLGARNKLMRLADDSLRMIEDEVLRLDREFDAIITDAHVFMLKVRSVEYRGQHRGARGGGGSSEGAANSRCPHLSRPEPDSRRYQHAPQDGANGRVDRRAK